MQEGRSYICTDLRELLAVVAACQCRWKQCYKPSRGIIQVQAGADQQLISSPAYEQSVAGIDQVVKVGVGDWHAAARCHSVQVSGDHDFCAPLDLKGAIMFWPPSFIQGVTASDHELPAKGVQQYGTQTPCPFDGLLEVPQGFFVVFHWTPLQQDSHTVLYRVPTSAAIYQVKAKYMAHRKIYTSA